MEYQRLLHKSNRAFIVHSNILSFFRQQVWDVLETKVCFLVVVTQLLSHHLEP